MANDRSRPSVPVGESNVGWWALLRLSVAELWRIGGGAGSTKACHSGRYLRDVEPLREETDGRKRAGGG